MDSSIEKKIYDLIAVKIAGKASAAELRQLEQLLSQYPEFRFLNDELSKPAYDTEKALAHAREAYLAHYYSKLYLGLQQEQHQSAQKEPAPMSFRKSRSALKYLSVAASLVVIAALLFLFYQKETDTVAKRDMSETVTQRGAKSRIILPDGTTVVLNADSKISYNKHFNESSRNIYLSGEAYFDVAHDISRPFIVHTSKASIKVLGTRFNVRDYPDDVQLATSLIKGKVEVTIKGPAGRTFILKPSDKLIIDKGLIEDIKTMEKAFQLKPVTQLDSVIAETSWVSNKMVYSNKPFPDIIKDLERQFDVSIQLSNEAIKKYRYTGDFEENNIDDILGILQIIKPFHYKTEGKTITIY
jgi:ferric-dicitrate binding protein FerR (iron transport regulator)